MVVMAFLGAREDVDHHPGASAEESDVGRSARRFVLELGHGGHDRGNFRLGQAHGRSKDVTLEDVQDTAHDGTLARAGRVDETDQQFPGYSDPL